MGKMKDLRLDLLNEDLDVLKFSWGDTLGLRLLITSIYQTLNIAQNMRLDTYGYPPSEGDLELVGLTRKLTESLTGRSYKHIAITAGCTHAVNASISALSDRRTKNVVTRDLYFPRYPTMIKLAGYKHKKLGSEYGADDVAVIDSPSNPLGLLGVKEHLGTRRVVLDAAYHSPTYGLTMTVAPAVSHEIFCGSFSKLLGINGLRLGWTATDDDQVHRNILYHIDNALCGVSYPSQYVVAEILKDEARLASYMSRSRAMIDANREEILRIKHIFGQDQMSNFGMFAFFDTDSSMEELFFRARVEFTNGRDCGADQQSVRISLANPNEMTKLMVDRILKADKRKGGL